MRQLKAPPSAEEVLKKNALIYRCQTGDYSQELVVEYDNAIDAMVEFATLQVKAALANAARDAKVKMSNIAGSKDAQPQKEIRLMGRAKVSVDRDSIFTAYHTDKIKRYK